MKALKEIPVALANENTLAIYHRLMAATGSGSPALIFRHMAVVPGLLEWVWDALGNDVESGWVREAVWGIVASTPPVPIEPITPSVLVKTGIDADAHCVITDILTSYNRMNPLNLILIGAIHMLISDTSLLKPVPLTSKKISPPPLAPKELPPPPIVLELEPALQDAIKGLCKALPGVGGEITPTLYRHLGIWPRFMMAVANRLKPQLDELDQATFAMQKSCGPLILDLAQRAKTRLSSPPPMTDLSTLNKVLDGFGYVIPHLIVVGRSVDAVMPR
jgi:hypothetical protein